MKRSLIYLLILTLVLLFGLVGCEEEAEEGEENGEADEVDVTPGSFETEIGEWVSYADETGGELTFALVSEEEHEGEPWSVRRSIAALALAGVAVGGMSEILVGSISEAAKGVGLSEFFIGAIVVAIVGNAAEHWVAVLVARKDKMDLAVNIAIGSSAQIALFAAPVLVLCSFFLGPHPMALVFNGFEVGAVILAVMIANHVTNEGESNWFEGVQLLAIYAILAIAFYYR